MSGANSKGSVRKILMSGNTETMQSSISDVMPSRAELEEHVETLLPKDWQDTPFSRPTVDLLRSTVDQIYDPTVPDDHVLDDFAVEAIVIADGSRPVSFIEDGKMLPPMGSGPFIDLMNRQAAAIETIGRSVGRVESEVRIAEPWMDGVFYAGSAFVVGPDLAMTNRHVAEIMIRGSKAGAGPFPLNGLWWLNFAGEHGSSARRRFAVLEVLWAGPDVIGTGSGLGALDMALLRLGPAEAGDVLPGALALTLDEPGEGQTVGIVGYPGRPRIVVEKPDDQLACAEEAERALIKVFDNRFGFKRAASGEVDAQPGFDGDVRGWTIRHDVSTLGGNSGSPIFDLGSGRPPRVLALHFGGCTRKTSYGTVFEKLRDDLQRHGALPG